MQSDVVCEDEKLGDENFTSSSDDGIDDTKPASENNSGSSWNVRDRNNNKKIQYKIENNWELPSIKELTINSDYDLEEDEVIPRLEKLTLDSDCELLTINKIAELSLSDDTKSLAGVVTSVAKVIGLIVVKPPIPHEVLLYLGSPVFLRKFSCAANSVSKDLKLGWIIDVFGPASEPYYCVKPFNNAGIELVHEGTELFYSPENPRTIFLRLKRDDKNRYTVLYSPRYPEIQDRGKGRQGEEHFWSNTLRRNRQSYRRRYENNNRGTISYRNKYRGNPRASKSMKPTHSYFDY